MSFDSHRWIQTRVTVRKRPIWDEIDYFFAPSDREIWRMTLENNRAPLLCYFKVCASFRSHWWIQTRVTVRKRPIGVKIGYLLCRVTLKLDGWSWKKTWKIIGYLFYATSSFVHRLIAMGQFKLKLQSGSTQTGAKFVLVSVTLTFDLWPWPFAWTSLLPTVTTPENVMMIRWQEHSKRGVGDRWMDVRAGGRTDGLNHS